MQISDEMVEAFGFAFFPVNAVSKIEDEKEGIRSALEAALSAAEPSVAVKALEWNETTAEAITGGYWIATGVGKHLYREPCNLLGKYNELEQAKAAAQADYEARIRSALTVQVQDVAVPERERDEQ